MKNLIMFHAFSDFYSQQRVRWVGGKRKVRQEKWKKGNKEGEKG